MQQWFAGRNTWQKIAIVVFLWPLALTGCGGGDDGEAGAGPTTTTVDPRIAELEAKVADLSATTTTLATTPPTAPPTPAPPTTAPPTTAPPTTAAPYQCSVVHPDGRVVARPDLRTKAACDAGQRTITQAANPTTTTTTTTRYIAPPTTAPPQPPPPTTATTKPAPVAPAPQEFSGTGTKVTAAFPIAGGLVKFVSSYVGSGNFSAELLDAGTGEYETLAVNEIGTKDTSRSKGVLAGSYVLNVKASGTWRIVVEQPRFSSGPPLPQTFSGPGTTATGPFEVTKQGLVQFRGRYNGTGNFSAEVLDARTGDYVTLAVNEVGTTDSTRAYGLKPGVYVLSVQAKDSWSIDVTA